jgi:ABC-type transporter Mla MlaB component
MATQDNSLGLLSKVAKFVRNPTKDWSELDKPDTEVIEDDGKQALKQMIIRKRHDDAVRKYEFAQLRKLRRDPAAAKSAVVPTPTGFTSSSGDIDDDERESTLKKIDDIEAQMSQQWWKGRGHPPGQAAITKPPVEASPSVMNDTVVPNSGMAGFQATVPSQQFDSSDDVPTKISMAGAVASADYISTVPGGAAGHQGLSVFENSGRVDLTSALPSSDPLSHVVVDPELEEAAIRYANGDDVGAESVLQAAVLQDASLVALEGRLAALLDLYRGGGQQANFERTALDYAQRIGRSAPMWTPTRPLQFGDTHAGRAGQSEATTLRWDCPGELDGMAVERLGFFGGSGSTVHLLDWTSVERITASAVMAFSKLVAQWCSKPLVFSFVGVENLLAVLQGMSVAGDRQVPQQVWLLRLELLRLLRHQDDYERVALDFCITYEISPPAWRAPLCHLVEKTFGDATEQESFAATLMSGAVTPALGADIVPGASDVLYSLSGELMGDIKVMVADLEQRPKPEGIWIIACEQLVRVDFSAAGALLNWVAQAQADGAAIEFQQVPRLVAAFFNLIGISDYARVVPRFV